MASSENRNRRKELLVQQNGREKENFEKSLPISRQSFKNLFDFLNENLSECDDTLKFTGMFLKGNNVNNIDEIKLWLQEHGGYCDCEVLANVEEKFE